MQIEASERPRRRLVSLTPLIDVVFILLVFFMLASTFNEWRALELAVPGDAAEPAQDAPAPLHVRVGVEGLWLDGEPIAADALEGAIRDRLEAEPDRPVSVRPDGDVALQRVVTVLERLQPVTDGRVSLQRGE